MIQPSCDKTDLREASSRTLLLAVAVLGVAFFFTEHDLGKSRLESFSATAEEMGDSVQTGDLRRQLGFSLVGALGLFFLLRRDGRPFGFNDPLAWLLLAYLAWCAASVAWSADPGLTVKRVAVLGLLALGALGLARQFSPRQLCLLATTLLAGYCALGVGAEIAAGTFRPWSGDYRFGGTMHPNSQGHCCAVLCLAAAALARRPVRENLLPWALLAAGAIFMVLTRSRSAFAGLAVALPVVVLFKMPPRAKLVAGFAAIWAVCTASLACAVLGMDPEKQLADAVLMGRSEDAATLSGRIPLWNELLPYIHDRPLLGYGYDSFWNPERIEDVSEASDWAIHVAHSVYLEAVLSVGLVGAFLLLAAACLGVCRLGVRYAATRDGGYGFLLGLLVFGLVSGLLESSFVQPMFLPMVAGCGLAHVALCRREVSL